MIRTSFYALAMVLCIASVAAKAQITQQNPPFERYIPTASGTVVYHANGRFEIQKASRDLRTHHPEPFSDLDRTGSWWWEGNKFCHQVDPSGWHSQPDRHCSARNYIGMVPISN